MSIEPGTYTLGPDNAALIVYTGRSGAIARVGHDLVIDVTAWSATIEVATGSESAELSLSADPASLRVREGTGGVQSLGDDDKENIGQTINDEVLKGAAIEFRSTTVTTSPDDETLDVQGELELWGTKRPVGFTLRLDGDHVTGEITLKQTGWGQKPYSALFGTLKVADEVRVEIDGRMEST